MSCAYSKEILALYVEGDLANGAAADVRRHLGTCRECSAFCEGLEASQSILKTLKGSAATPEALSTVRLEVMSRLDDVAGALGWQVRLERFLLLGFRKWRYATAGVAALAILAILTSTVDGQRPLPGNAQAAMFMENNTLILPEGYSNWVPVKSETPAKRVFINPESYRVFTETGRFPEGTVMALESATDLQVSVKDNRFAGGWGYFDFPDRTNNRSSTDDRNCMTCHEARAETDHVFTQFYPALKLRRS